MSMSDTNPATIGVRAPFHGRGKGLFSDEERVSFPCRGLRNAAGRVNMLTVFSSALFSEEVISSPAKGVDFVS